MSDNTKIQWTDATWSPLRVRVRENAAEIAREKGYASLIEIAERTSGRNGQHCEKVSAGCQHCYSERMQGRCIPANGTGLPFDRRSRDLVEPYLDQFVLAQPSRWGKSRRIFVENQSDLFGEWWHEEDVVRVHTAMREARHHTYQVLTKRPLAAVNFYHKQWMYYKNLHISVSVEDQESANERIPQIINAWQYAGIVWVSYEPAIGPVVLSPWLRSNYGRTKIEWVVVGGESGSGARRFELEWAQQVIEQCRDAGVPVFVKQLGSNPTWGGSPVKLHDRKGGDMAEWPEHLRVREFPA